MRSLILVVALVACGNPPASKRPNGTGSATGSGKVVTTPGGGVASTGGPSSVRDIGCLKPTCVFHPGAGGYFTCQSAGAGTCFHFGAPCTPEGTCMYDPAAKSYKQCTTPLEGQCLVWGAGCAPASKCMFDAKDNMHRTCDSINSGTCNRFGALCSP